MRVTKFFVVLFLAILFVGCAASKPYVDDPSSHSTYQNPVVANSMVGELACTVVKGSVDVPGTSLGAAVVEVNNQSHVQHTILFAAGKSLRVGQQVIAVAYIVHSSDATKHTIFALKQ